MSDLYIPNSVALRNFDTLFTNNDFKFDDKTANIRFHPSYVAMHPVGLAFYAAISDYFILNKINAQAFINKEIRSIPYLQRMGLFEVMGFEDPIKVEEHEETGRFIPLRKIRNSDELNNLLVTIDPILHTSRENSRVIKHVFSELLRNVLEHANASRGGNVCATYNRKKKKISIGISDAGIGIYNSMKRFHSLSSHGEAINKALTPGITGKTSRIGGTSENAGAGLFFTKCIAQSTRNHFLIYSGDTYFKLKLTPQNKELIYNSNPVDDYKSFRSELPYFKGTLIGIDINITDSHVFNELIHSIGDAYMKGVSKNKKDYFKKINFI